MNRALYTVALFILETNYTSGRTWQLFVVRQWLYVSRRVKLRRIIRRGELLFAVCIEQRATEDYSARWIMRLVPVFILETNNNCLPKFVQTDNACFGVKMLTVTYVSWYLRMRSC